MTDFLDTMAAASRQRVQRARRRMTEGALLRRASLRPAPPRLRLHPSGFDVIAEIKPSSPSAGLLEHGEASIARAQRYADGGAAAISVLTEPSAFGGSLALLRDIAIAVVAPVLRKDFLVDPYQVVEARDEGASGVLLIARLLDDALLAGMLATAAGLGLFALVESFDRNDLERSLAAASAAQGEVLIGVNARDLRTLEIDPKRLAALAPYSHLGSPFVAESGIDGARAAGRAARLGYAAALVGETLMRSPTPAHVVAAMLEAGRAAATHDGLSR